MTTPLLPTLTPTHSGSMPAVNRVYHCDWLSLVSALPAQSVDAFITDLPYGTTACTWDEIIPFAPMWEQVKRTLKPRGVFVTTASQPFTSKLVMSNLDWFHEELAWDKKRSVGFLDANRKHMKRHENVIVFCEGLPTYNPQGTISIVPHKSGSVDKLGNVYGTRNGGKPNSDYVQTIGNYPHSIIEFASETGLHPTQKPVALYEYLIRTYTQEGELVVDFCAGSGTTAVAARNTKRDYIIGDTDAGYVAIAKDRLRTSILEPRHVSHDDDVTTMDVKDGYRHTLFAANATA